MDSDARIAADLAALEAAGNLRTLHRVRPEGLYLRHEGRRYLNLSSNDYLALSASPYSTLDLRHYAAEAWGAERLSPHLHGNPASRLMTADSEEYDILESELAALFPGRAALVLSCGYMLNSGLMPALADKSELILADKLVHASMIEGLTHGVAEFRRFPHNDLAALERQLQCAAGRGVWVLVESLYSMDGDSAPLRELAALKERYGFRLYVDEAHSFAVRGPQGKGLCAELGIDRAVDLLVCTFGKAMAGAGAAVICSPLVRRLLINRLRPLIFSTALPPITLLWDAMVLREMRTEALQAQGYPGMGRLRAQLAANLRRFTELTGIPATSQIIPLPCGSNEQALTAAEAGRAAGLWLTAIRRPTVPAGSERIRLSLNAGLTDTHLQQLADLCRKLG